MTETETIRARDLPARLKAIRDGGGQVLCMSANRDRYVLTIYHNEQPELYEHDHQQRTNLHRTPHG